MGRTPLASAAAPDALCSQARGLINILRQQERSHLTSAPPSLRAKLRFRKHLLKREKGNITLMEALDWKLWVGSSEPYPCSPKVPPRDFGGSGPHFPHLNDSPVF